MAARCRFVAELLGLRNVKVEADICFSLIQRWLICVDTDWFVCCRIFDHICIVSATGCLLTRSVNPLLWLFRRFQRIRVALLRRVIRRRLVRFFALESG